MEVMEFAEDLFHRAFDNAPSEHNRFYLLCKSERKYSTAMMVYRSMHKTVQKTVIVKRFDEQKYRSLLRYEPHIFVW